MFIECLFHNLICTPEIKHGSPENGLLEKGRFLSETMKGPSVSFQGRHVFLGKRCSGNDNPSGWFQRLRFIPVLRMMI